MDIRVSTRRGAPVLVGLLTAAVSGALAQTAPLTQKAQLTPKAALAQQADPCRGQTGRIAQRLIESGRCIQVPAVLGQNYNDALRQLAQAGLRMTSATRTSDDTPGLIIDQEPQAGAAVMRGATVKVTLPYAPPLVLPSFVGIGLDEARSRLPKGLELSATPQESARPRDEVLSQRPAAGSRVRRDSVVALQVSDGSLVEVPAVVKQSLATARTALAEAGLAVQVSDEASDAPIGQVTAQKPAPGSLVKRDSAVTLRASTGLEMPALVGRPLAEAQAALQRFSVSSVEADSPQPAGQVLAQNPPAHARVAAGSAVRLSVSNGAIVTVPALQGLGRDEAAALLQAGGLQPAIAQGLDWEQARVDATAPPAGSAVKRGSTVLLTLVLPPWIWAAGGIAAAAAAAGWRALRRRPVTDEAPPPDTDPGSAPPVEIRPSASIQFNTRPLTAQAGGPEAPTLGLRASLQRGPVEVRAHQEESP